MIVTIAGWLYILNAALVLLSLRSSLPGVGFSGQLGTLLLGAGMGAIGVGLLKRETWGRWFALGPSLLGWTIGALLALGMLALLFWFFANSSSLGGFAGFIGFLIIFITVLSIVGVVINFKLYWHLVSEDGKEEFSAPESDSFVTVLQSAGVWIVACVLSAMMSGSGSLLGGAALAGILGSSGEDEPAQVSQPEPEPDAEPDPRAELAREREAAERRRKEIQEIERRSMEEQVALEKARVAAAAAPPPQPAEAEPNYSSTQSAVSAPEAIVEPPAPDDEKRIDMKKILKCRDSSGGVQFTQGYCPPGTKEVAASNSQ